MFSEIRVYESEQQAQSVVQQLTRGDDGISAACIWMQSQGSSGHAEDSPVWSSGIPYAYRQFFNEQVQRGRAVLAVDPPYGLGQRVLRILDGNDPVDVALPALKPDNPAPLSTYLGMSALSDKPPKARLITVPPDRSFGFGLLSNNPTPLSSRFGMKVLSKRPGNTSFGMPLLSQPKRNWNTSFGLPLLTRKG